MHSLARFLVLATVAIAGCAKFDRLLEGTDVFDGTLSVSLPSTSVTVAQGKEISFNATVTRTGELKNDVSITVSGVPTGVSVVVGTPATSERLTTATITISATTGASVGNYVLTVRANSGTAAGASALMSLAVTRAPAFTLGVSSTALTIARGGIAPLAVRLTRTNLDAPIALALSGPGGITAAFGTNPIAGDSTTGTISVAPTTAPGTYTVSLRATTEALADQTAQLSVTVTADPLQVIVPPRLTTAQGATVLAPVIVNRGGFSGSVSLSAEDLPPDVTATFDPSTTTGGTSSMSLRVGPSTPPGNHAIRVRGRGAGVPDATASLELSVTPTSVAITVSPAEVSVFQGGAAAMATARITRTNYTGAVEITADSTTPGLSISAQPASITGDTATLSLSASGNATPGQYTVTIRGTPAGFPSTASAIATLVVTIRPAPPGGGNVVLDWSRCAAPDWVAYQDGTSAWVQAPVASGVARFTIASTRGGIAYVENASSVTVRFGLQTEFIAKPIDMCPARTGTKTVTGFVSLGATIDVMSFRLGGASANATGAAPAFTLSGVEDGTHDLVGWGQVNPFGRRGILRRDLNLPSGASLGPLDPLGIESFVPATALLTLTGVAVGEQTSHSMYYMTTDACTPNFLYQANNTQLIGVPSGIQRATDYHRVEAIAISGTRQRTATTTFQTLANRSVALPPIPIVPAVATAAGGTNYKRLSAGVGLVPVTYNESIALRYNDGSSKTMSVTVSPAYLSAVGVVTFGMPDFSGVSGWSNSYAVASSATGTWVVSVAGSTTGVACSEGKTTYLTTQTGRF